MFVIFAFANNTGPAEGLASLGALPVAFLVLVIGLSLGGTTGYAINPARDLGPRIAHFLLPIPGKRDSDWSYSWIPVVGPLIGGGARGGRLQPHASPNSCSKVTFDRQQLKGACSWRNTSEPSTRGRPAPDS